MPEPRRLTPPWKVVEHEESYEILSASGQSLAYVYFDREERPFSIAKRLSQDEARRVAANIARLPELLRKD